MNRNKTLGNFSLRPNAVTLAALSIGAIVSAGCMLTNSNKMHSYLCGMRVPGFYHSTGHANTIIMAVQFHSCDNLESSIHTSYI